MSHMQCNVCGSITGEHGFSFSKKAIEAQRSIQKKNAGILLIPKEIVPEGMDEDKFLKDFIDAINDSLTRPCAPEVRWMEEDNAE